MPKNEVVLRVGGAAGDGIASTGESFAKICSRSGLHLLAYNSYQSVIRGGFIYLQLRAGREKIYSHGNKVDFLIALNPLEFQRNIVDVVPGGAVLYNSDKIKPDSDTIPKDVILCPLPVNEILKDIGRNPILQNTVALSSLVQLLNLDVDVMNGVIRDYFGKKKQSVMDINLKVIEAGYDYAKSNLPDFDFDLNPDYNIKRPVLTGNQALGFGSIIAGCKIYCAYPMTPASSILHYLIAQSKKSGMVVKQAEDEISVINMEIGSSFEGVRSMVGTSGGGFALMTEAIGLAGQTETPIVVINSMRGGPSTGLPTKTEQGDLFQAIGASQGDFPKVIIAPSTIEDCYYSIIESFNLADQFQIPVMVLSDLFLSEHMESIVDLDFNSTIERGEIVTSNDSDKLYKRFKYTDNGVSPRAFPGTSNTVFQASSDEHDDYGNIISDVFTDSETRIKIMLKRMRKMKFIEEQLPPVKLEGPVDADLTIVSWGSTYNVVHEAIQILQNNSKSVNHLHIKYLVPLQKGIKEILSKSKDTLIVEANYSGQLSKLISMETGFQINHTLFKYDGEPFYPEQIIDKVEDLI